MVEVLASYDRSTDIETSIKINGKITSKVER